MEIMLLGDALSQLRLVASESVNTVVTSPPYYGLRDYSAPGQIGLEDTPEEYITKLVEVFHEIRRTLRPDGTLWLNIGDSYATRSGRTSGAARGKNRVEKTRSRNVPPGYKHKDLIGVPWMLAFALRADGWYLRQDIVWQKTNAMPESVTDRCTRSHEFIFLLTKSERYYFDAAAIREPRIGTNSLPVAGSRGAFGSAQSRRRNAKTPSLKTVENSGLRNRRDVWSVATSGGKTGLEHFATFPEQLIEPCVLAGCPEGGMVMDPFSGSGTTGVVAKRLWRNFIGIELNEGYWKMARERIAKTNPEFRQYGFLA